MPAASRATAINPSGRHKIIPGILLFPDCRLGSSLAPRGHVPAAGAESRSGRRPPGRPRLAAADVTNPPAAAAPAPQSSQAHAGCQAQGAATHPPQLHPH